MRIMKNIEQRGTLARVSLIFLVLVVAFTVPAPEVAAAANSCWTSKPTYQVGELVAIYFNLGWDEYDYQVMRPDGSIYGPVYLGFGPGRTSDSNTAGNPTGRRTVQLFDRTLGRVVAQCIV